MNFREPRQIVMGDGRILECVFDAQKQSGNEAYIILKPNGDIAFYDKMLSRTLTQGYFRTKESLVASTGRDSTKVQRIKEAFANPNEFTLLELQEIYEFLHGPLNRRIYGR